MARIHLLFKGCIVCFVLLSMISCKSDGPIRTFRDADFNARWEFFMGDTQDPFGTELEASSWTRVHLPHDWSIMDYELQDTLHEGPFFKNLPGGADVGYLRNGTAWYRKAFASPLGSENKRIILCFDGVSSQMELWVNGVLIGEHVYGYTPFYFDISSVIKEPGKMNMIAVKTANPGENSRWYAGSGVYRQVKISMLYPVAVTPWGVHVTTPEVSEDRASIEFEIEVSNTLESEVDVSGEILIQTPDAQLVQMDIGEVSAGPASNITLRASTLLMNPKRWSVDQPDLYTAEIILYADGDHVDTYHTTFGIRSIAYSAEKGFRLNGEEFLMKGACMHHDNGLLGAVAFRDAEFRRVRRMKENGYNAIRTSHNPPSEAFLNACDSLGMLVIDESFDHWVKPKRPNDYSNYFEEWHIRDIQAMVYRDRNHPSVVMWSFGNEVQERADPDGIEIGKALAAAIREVDNTRPVTQAVCGFWDNPGKEWDDSEGAFSMLDIGGYNYQYEQYESDHRKHPERIMYGSESVPQHAWENWEKVKRLPYVIGDFVWTGMDYIGESGIGHTRLVDKGAKDEGNFLKPWPWYISWCGDLDILGNKKPQSYYRDVIWGESKLELMVSMPLPDGMESRISYWGWYDEFNHWNWEGYEEEAMQVRVYSSYPEVKLELNGVELGQANISRQDKYIAQFRVPYQAGELRAIGMEDGKEVESIVLKTAGPATQLALYPEERDLTAHPNALAFIQVEALDNDSLLRADCEDAVQVKVSGPARLLAAGNASPLHQGSFTDRVFHLFRGRGMVIIRSTGQSGTIEVEVDSDNLESAKITLEAL
jgi:beta-galactosidase